MSVLSILVFITSMSVTYLVLERNEQHEQSTPKITQSSETISTIEETQTTTTESSYSNESTQEEVVAPSVQPPSTEEYTVNNYLGVDTYSNLNADNYSITRNSDGVRGVLIVESPYSMQWFYDDNRGLIYTN